MKFFSVTALLLGSVSAGPLIAVGTSPLQSRVKRTSPGLDAVQPANQPDAVPSDETWAKFKTAKKGDSFLEGNTMFIFEGREEGSSGANGKRQSCGTQTYTAVQVPSGQAGIWTGSWEPADGCTSNNGGSGTDAQMSATVNTYEWTTGDFDQSTTNTVLGIINGQSSLNQGYRWAFQATYSTNEDCYIPANSVAQIWSQSKFGWSNSQTQQCTGSDCSNQRTCGAWSAYQHANWALPDNQGTIQWGCSSGSNCQC